MTNETAEPYLSGSSIVGLQQLLECSFDSAFLLHHDPENDEPLVVMRLNRSASALVGAGRSNPIGKSVGSALSLPDLDPKLKELFFEAQSVPFDSSDDRITSFSMDRVPDGSVSAISSFSFKFLPHAVQALLIVRPHRQEHSKIPLQSDPFVPDDEFLERILDTVSDPVFVKDERHRWIVMNDAFCRMIGLPRSELFGKSDYDFFPKEQADVFWEMDRQTFAIGDAEATVNEEELTDAAGNTIVLSTKKAVLQTSDGARFLVGVIRDMSAMKKAQDELRVAKEAAERAALAKTQFLSNMSHELRTPLNGVIGLTALLRDTKLDPDQRENVELLLHSTEHLLGVIDDILDYARIDSGKLELVLTPFNLKERFLAVYRILEMHAHEKRLDSILEVDPNLPKIVLGDPQHLSQVLINLISNAIKFSERTGGLILRCEVIEQDQKSAFVRFAIADTGIGVSAHGHETAVEPFEKVDSSFQRRFGETGLGLTISRKLVEAMGGSLHVRSIVGKGTCFSFAVPFIIASEPDATLDRRMAGSFVSLRVLLVEDNAVNLRVATRMLERLGHQVCVAANGIDALAMLENDGPFDVAFVDVQMPEMDGFTFTARVRENERSKSHAEPKPRLPLVAMTAHVMSGDREKCIEAGMDEHLGKPIALSELERILKGIGEKIAQSAAR